MARDRRHIKESERIALDAKYHEIGRMLTGLIRFLQDEDGKDRL